MIEVEKTGNAVWGKKWEKFIMERIERKGKSVATLRNNRRITNQCIF